MFNLLWGTIIGFTVGVLGKLLMGKEEEGSLPTITVGGVCGSLAMGCLVGLWDPASGIIASYLGAVLSVVIYRLIKSRREL